MSVYVDRNASDAKREAAAKIEELLDQAQQLVYEAESLADKHGLEFSICIGGYGMGGSYTGAAAVDDWQRSEYDVEDGEGFWSASSQSY